MLPKKVLLIPLLLIHWGLSSGQTSDSIRFSVDEARQIAIKLTELKECRELLTVTEQQVVWLDSMVVVHRDIAESYHSEIALKDEVINLHLDNEAEFKDQIKIYKKRSVITMVLSGVVVVGVILMK